MQCHKCHVERETKVERLPTGWKRHQASIWCDKCWRASYCLRAITFRVASPVGQSWADFRAVLKTMWAESTRMANWMTTQFYVRDTHREPTHEKCPPMPKVYLYPEARVQFPALPSQTVAAAEQAYKAKYRAKRYKILWTCEESLPNYRYPEPFCCPNQGWSAEYRSLDVEGNEKPGADPVPCVSVRIGEARWSLRLKGGHRYRRQLVAFSKIVSGEAVQGELAIYRQRANGREGETKERDASGQRQTYYVMVKLVAWLPKREWQQRDDTLHVRTDSESLLVALNVKDERLWVWHADHIRRAVARQRRQMQRWSDDQKAENRPADFQARRTASASKYRHTMSTAVKQAARYLVGYAVRRKFAAIRYDDTDKRYVDRFPWHELRQRIATLCNESNISLTFASGEVEAEMQESLADES